MTSRARFLTNLRTLTMDRGFRESLRPDGYLVPPAYLTVSGAQFIDRSRQRRGFVVLDNGRYDDIGRVVARFADDAARLVARSRESAGAGVDPVSLYADVAALVARISEVTGGPEPVVPTIGRLNRPPTAFIGLEDITSATWVRLGLELPMHRDGRADLRRRNERVARHAVELEASAQGTPYLPVADAMDHDTARDAGRAFAKAGLTGAAMGFGAYMADNSYVSRYKRDGHWRLLPTRMPQRYLRSVLVARGFWDGWAEESNGGAPEHFHFLGLGAPIMIGLVSLVAAATPQLTFDATSPIQDATQGTLYVLDPAYLKVRTRRIAENLASGSSRRWSCGCPFCRDFMTRHPFDLSAGRSWWAQHRGAEVGAAELRPAGALYEAFPLLSEPTGGLLRNELDRARIGHNHWVLQRTVAAVNRHRDPTPALGEHLDKVVSDYERATNAPSFAAAVRFAYELAGP